MFKVPNEYRERKHPLLKSSDEDGNNGMFRIPHLNMELRCQASDGMGWEHVSVSIAKENKTPHRCPDWTEMCKVKDLFWDKTDCVIQYHPAESEYVNMHPFVLHLWRPIGVEIPIPNKLMVGI